MKPCDRAYYIRQQHAEWDRQTAAVEDPLRLARMRQQPETAEARYFVPLTHHPAYNVDLAKIQNQP